MSDLSTRPLRRMSDLSTRPLRRMSDLSTRTLRRMSDLSTRPLRRMSDPSARRPRRMSDPSTRRPRRMSDPSTRPLYHVAPASAREQIAEHGIDHARAETSYYGHHNGTNVSKANYMFASLEAARGWKRSHRSGPRDIWQVETSGLTLVADLEFYTPDWTVHSYPEPPQPIVMGWLGAWWEGQPQPDDAEAYYTRDLVDPERLSLASKARA